MLIWLQAERDQRHTDSHRTLVFTGRIIGGTEQTCRVMAAAGGCCRRVLQEGAAGGSCRRVLQEGTAGVCCRRVL